MTTFPKFKSNAPYTKVKKKKKLLVFPQCHHNHHIYKENTYVKSQIPLSTIFLIFTNQ